MRVPVIGPVTGRAPAAVGLSERGRREIATSGADEDVRFRVASLTKPVTAVAAVRAAAAAGAPGLGVRLRELLPGAVEWRLAPDLTLEHVLAQVALPAGTVTAADVAALGEGPDVLAQVAVAVAAAGGAPVVPARWHYENAHYFLAGAAIEALTGLAFEDAVRTLVLEPAAMASSGFLADDATVPTLAYPRGRRPSGGLCSTVPDLLAFAEWLLGQPELLALVATDRTRHDDPARYGLGWALGPSGQLYLNGRLPGLRGAMVLVPDAGLAAVGLCAHDESLPQLAAVLDELQRPVTGDVLAPLIDAFAA